MLDFIALDVETANEDYASICQIGVALVMDGKVCDTWGTYVNPGTHFTNTWRHGIDKDTVRGAPDFPHAINDLYPLLHRQVMVHHSGFDRTALTQAADKHQVQLPAMTMIDSARMVRRVNRKFVRSGFGLDNLCHEYGIPADGRHDAVGDARIAAQLVIKLLQESNTTIADWASMKKRTDGSYQSRVMLDGNPEGPLAGTTFVFTGSLQTPRLEAARMAADLGANVRETVNAKATYLVVGLPSWHQRKDRKFSTKHLAALKLQSEGSPIQILDEQEFTNLVEDAQLAAGGS